LEFPNGSVTLSGGAIDITGDTIINVSAGTHVIDSKIQGVGNLIKTGPGVLVLSHPENTFTGLLDVAAGTVRVTGTITEPKGIEIKSGATLENRGLVGASVNVASGGTYEGGGEVAGDLLSQGMLRVTAGEVLRVAGRIVSDGALDIMTGAQELPPNLVHNGVILDRSLLKIASLSKIADGYSVTIDGYSGHEYQLQRTESLSGPWANVGASQAGTSHGLTTPTLLTLSDSSPSERQCFYGVVVSP
jgi:autotransporter-associated beta strand protein